MRRHVHCGQRAKIGLPLEDSGVHVRMGFPEPIHKALIAPVTVLEPFRVQFSAAGKELRVLRAIGKAMDGWRNIHSKNREV